MSDSGELRVRVDAAICAEADERILARAVRRTLEVEGCDDADFSLALVDDASMRDLNARYLGENRTTDVLAFSLGEADEVIGDVYVGFEQARRQASDHGVPVEEELLRLAIHGTLHVLGHDHPEGPERDRSAMFELQERLVRELRAES